AASSVCLSLPAALPIYCLPGAFHGVSASALAQSLFGDTVTAHTLMLGYAWQLGLVPLSQASIEQAIELNGAAVALNKRAFAWGRSEEHTSELQSHLNLV